MNTADREAVRAAAAAVLAQQTALGEREAQLREQARELSSHEAQLASRLDEKLEQINSLLDQLAEGRDELRRQRSAADQYRREAEVMLREVRAERDRLLELRARFIRRLKRLWVAEREAAEWERHNQELAEQEAERATARLIAERKACDQALEELANRQRQLDEERARFEQERRDAENDLRRRELALAEAQRQLAAERDEAETRNAILRDEAHGLERRISAARLQLARMSPGPELPPTIVTVATPAVVEEVPLRTRLAELTDQRALLAELCSRLTAAESRRLQDHLDTIAAMEQMADELIAREQRIQRREEELAEQANRLKQEREALARQKQQIERRDTESQLRQSTWQGERNLLRIELEGTWRTLKRRDEAMRLLLARWRERRTAEIDEARRWSRLAQQSRARWEEEREEYHRRAESLRVAQQALTEQALALEEARQAFLSQCDRPKAVARRLERLRRRWQGLTAASRRALEKQQAQLAKEDTQLRQIYRELEQEKERLARRERDLNQQQTELEEQQRRTADVRMEFEEARRTWGELRRQYDLMLIDLRFESQRQAA